MGEVMRRTARPYLTLFGLALVVALLGRVALGVAGATGILAFDYISASGVPMLDVVCSILTGSALVAFMFAAGLALVVSTAGPVLGAALYARGEEGAGRPVVAFLWGWATALAAVVCLAVLALGILSAVQVGSMSSKLPGLPVIALGAVAFAAFIGTLLAAAQMVLVACVERARAGRSLAASLLVACAACGAVTAALTLGTFAALNQASVQVPALLGWVAADVAANLLMTALAARVARRARAAKAAGSGGAVGAPVLQ